MAADIYPPATPPHDFGKGRASKAATQALESCVLIELSRQELTNSRTLLAQSRSMVRQTRALIEECEQLLADGRTLLGESKPLLRETVQKALSIRVFQKGSCFGWRVFSRMNETLGRGTAETELKARVAAFDAGMTYIDRLKGRTTTTDGSLH